MAATHGSGLSVMPGGNLLDGRFKSEDPTGMTVQFSVPAGMTLDPGDGTAPIATDGSGFVDHTYVGSGNHPWVFTAASSTQCFGLNGARPGPCWDPTALCPQRG